MMTVAKKKSDQSGQALIELIIFLPLMFALYSMISGFASAINGSINQQKVTRAYFYYRVQNNSNIPKPDGGDQPTWKNWSKFGMYFIGWKDYFQGDFPVMPCYQNTIPLAPAPSDTCEETYSDEKTQFIRVGTVYGICGATFAKIGNSVIFLPDYLGANFQEVTDYSSCLIQ